MTGPNTLQAIEPPAALRTVQTGPHANSLRDMIPLSQLVHDSIMACDVDVRAALLQNIVVVGNTSLTKGLTERLDVELASLMPSVSSPMVKYSNADRYILAKDQDPLANDPIREEVFLLGRGIGAG